MFTEVFSAEGVSMEREGYDVCCWPVYDAASRYLSTERPDDVVCEGVLLVGFPH